MARRFEKSQIDLLKAAFEESEHLTKEKKIYLARVTGLDMEQITSWFNRKRGRKRAKEAMGELERINTELKKTLQQHQEQEMKLQHELQQSRRKEAELEEENQRLKRRLTIIEGDLRFDSIISSINGYL
ncbi:hypothetical protein CDL12_01728 [Handroanthus impetiginosus]|uniref:Homeobox domain-containing protein n=1 Tax=Handroanthus impetiginosus TaxID=429701 RepID=A0A2G9I6Z9_9LAMI|nr:hypothetical protein CDL12_01728 [Handroanthus impetiginosus]